MSENYFNKYYRALVYDELEEYQTLIEELTEYIEVNKQNSFAYNNRGVALWEIGKNEDAIKDFERAIELSSNDSQPYLNLGHLFEAEGNIKKAIELYTKVIDINNDISAFISRAYAYEKINCINEAVQDLSQAIIAQPEFNQHYLTRAKLYKMLGKLELAAQDYKTVNNLKEQRKRK